MSSLCQSNWGTPSSKGLRSQWSTFLDLSAPQMYAKRRQVVARFGWPQLGKKPIAFARWCTRSSPITQLSLPSMN